MSQLFLRQGVEHVGLVLFQIRRAQQQFPPADRVGLPPDIVPGRNVCKPPLKGIVQHDAELDLLVAENAGVRRLPGQIGADEREDYLSLEILPKGGDAVRNSQSRGHGGRILGIPSGIVRRRAARQAVAQAQSNAADFHSRLQQQGRRGRTVDPTAHTYKNLLHIVPPITRICPQEYDSFYHLPHKKAIFSAGKSGHRHNSRLPAGQTVAIK